jgi:transcriptional regulator with XRE-family HTH domain
MAYLRHEVFLKKFGENLRKIRLRKGFSQDEISFSTSISTNQVGRIERGEINTGLSTIYEIANCLGIEVKELFDFDSPPSP